MENNNSETMTVEQAAAYLHVSTRTVYTAMETGKLKAYKMPGGRKWTIKRADLEAYLIPNTTK